MVRSWRARYIFILKITLLYASSTRGNYFGHSHEPELQNQYYFPDYFDQVARFRHFSSSDQARASDRVQNFNNHRDFRELNSIDTSPQFRHVDEDHLANQQSEHDEFANNKHSPLHTFTGEQKPLNYHDRHNFPRHFNNFKNPGQILNYDQQEKFDKFRDIHSPSHNYDGEYHHMSNRDNFNYLSQYRQLNHPKHDHLFYQQAGLSQFRNPGKPHLQSHNSSGEYKPVDYHDKLSYFNQFPQLNYSKPDQQLHQDNGYRVHSQSHPHTGEHQNLNSQDKFSHSNQLQLHNYPTSWHLNHKDNIQHPDTFNQPNIGNSGHEQQVNYRSVHNNPIQLPEFNPYSRDQHFNQQDVTDQHSISGNHQQNNGYERPAFYQQNHPSDSSKILSYTNPHQPSNPGYSTLNKEYDHPSNLPQLNNVDPHQKLNQESLSDRSQHLNETELSRNTREDQQLIYHGNIVPGSRLQNTDETSDQLHNPSNLHQAHEDQVEKIYYRNSPEQFDHSGLPHQQANPSRFSQFNRQFGSFGQFMQPSHFRNPGQFGRFMDPSQFSNPSQFGKLMNPSHFSNPAQYEKFMGPSHFSNSGQPGNFFNPSRYFNPSQFGELNQQNTFRQSRYPNNPQQRSYSKREGFGLPIAGDEKNQKYSFPGISGEQDYLKQNNEQKNMNVTGNPKDMHYLNYLRLLSNLGYFNPFNQQNIFTETGNQSGIHMRSYSGESQKPNNNGNLSDTAGNVTSLNPTHHEQKEHPNHDENSTAKNLTAEYDDSTSFQELNPDYTNQPNFTVETEEPVNLNDSLSHSSSTAEELLNYTNESQRHMSQDQFQHFNDQQTPKEQIFSTQTQNSGENKFTGDFRQLQTSSLADQFQTNNYPDVANMSENLQEQLLNNNFTRPEEQNNSGESQLPNFQNQSEQFITQQVPNQQKFSSQMPQSINSSKNKLTSNESELQKRRDVDQFHLNDYFDVRNRSENLDEDQLNSNSARHQGQNYSGESKTFNSQNQSHLLTDEQVSKEGNFSSQIQHLTDLSENNETGIKSQLQENSHVDQFQQSDYLAVTNRSVNGKELGDNFTSHQQQNHRDFYNDSTSVNQLKNSTSQHHELDPYNREQRQLEFPNYPSPMQYYFRSSQPQKHNPFNQINKPNIFMPMDQSNQQSYWAGNQEFKNFVPPSICYLDKMHGPCNGVIPSFFYNSVSKRCEYFIYGGCYGNANNFATIEECESVCMMYPQNGFAESKYPQQWHFDNLKYEDPALPLWHPGPELVHEFCSLEKRKGPCHAIFRRYFFNQETKTCEEFLYGGCYGNANNFFTKEECEFVCKSL